MSILSILWDQISSIISPVILSILSIRGEMISNSLISHTDTLPFCKFCQLWQFSDTLFSYLIFLAFTNTTPFPHVIVIFVNSGALHFPNFFSLPSVILSIWLIWGFQISQNRTTVIFHYIISLLPLSFFYNPICLSPVFPSRYKISLPPPLLFFQSHWFTINFYCTFFFLYHLQPL